MKVIIDTTFSGPLISRLLGIYRVPFFKMDEAVVRALEDRGPYHKGEVYTFAKHDVFTNVRFSGICTITYSGKPNWDDVPRLGEDECHALFTTTYIDQTAKKPEVSHEH